MSNYSNYQTDFPSEGNKRKGKKRQKVKYQSTPKRSKKEYRRDRCDQCGETLDKFTLACFICDDIEDI